MKRATATLCAGLIGLLIAVPAAEGAFGFKPPQVAFSEADGSPATQAGSHPFALTTIVEANTVIVTKGSEEFEVPDEQFKDFEVSLPPGLVGTPTPVPRCSAKDFLDIDGGDNSCPASTAVGFIELAVSIKSEDVKPGDDPFKGTAVGNVPVYNLQPPPGVSSKIGFTFVPGLPVTIESSLDPEPPHGIQSHVTNIPQTALFYGSRLTLWGVPADPEHDEQRGGCAVTTGQKCPVDLPEVPFLTLPRSCQGPLATLFEADSWQHPGVWTEPVLALSEEMIGCERLGFSPQISTQPTSSSAESPSGLDFSLTVEDEGLTAAGGVAHSDIKQTVVTLPEGVTINPSQAEGLGVCTPADYERETLAAQAGEGCPNSSKIGTVEVETPLLEGSVLKGSLFVAEPHRNPFGTLIALYMVFRERNLGIIVKQALKVEPDPLSGRLTTTATEIPQLPFSHFRLHFREGGRSPLVTPPACGTYTTNAELTPWARPDSPYTTTATFQIGSGAHGAPCPPGGTPPFDPGFEAGTADNAAAHFSPFSMRLTRRDGDQDLTRLATTLAPGLIAKLAGTAQCPEAAIATARAKSGREELAAPSCPPASRIGRVQVGAGVGPELTFVDGELYLAGPYNGAPLSVLSVVPAVAGPFDVGTVLTRFALRINPRTAQATVDGEASDPIPHILAGIPLKVRDIRAYVDKPQFTLNPTSCAPMAISARIWGGGANVFSPADDVPHARQAPFLAANCALLGFKPRLALQLRGGTKRGQFPAFRATYRPRKGDANLKRLSLLFPRTEFVEQGHFRTICTRVQFAADNCPKDSIYGHVRAFTPLLEEPLEGPVYLRSSNNELPDAVFALRGLVDAEAVARIDSVKGRLRATVTGAPDVPVSKVIVNMQGGQKGLIVNSRNLCRRTHRAKVKAAAHNGRRKTLRPALQAKGCAKSRPRSAR